MLSIERRNQIVEILREKNSVTVKELSSMFDVTDMTINRDLKVLSEENLINRIHGGATYQKRLIGELKFSQRILSRIKEKEAIARKAIEFIEEGDSLILYGGTTSIILARELAKNAIDNLTVVTNSDYIINELKTIPNIILLCTGGQYVPRLGIYSGLYAELILPKIKINKFFFSVAGASFGDGLTDSEPSEINLKRKMFETADKKILLLTSDKFNCASTHKIAPLKVVDMVITDNNIEKDKIKKINELGLELKIAGE